MSQKSKSLKRLNGLNDGELVTEEGDLRQAIWKLQLQRATGQSNDPNRLTISRRELARLLTVRRQRELKAAR
jgi:ribosomal protein L29